MVRADAEPLDGGNLDRQRGTLQEVDRDPLAVLELRTLSLRGLGLHDVGDVAAGDDHAVVTESRDLQVPVPVDAVVVAVTQSLGDERLAGLDDPCVLGQHAGLAPARVHVEQPLPDELVGAAACAVARRGARVLEEEVDDLSGLVAHGAGDKQPQRAQAWVTDDAVWYRPPRSDAYRPFTDEDARELAAAFEHHGRAALVPQR